MSNRCAIVVGAGVFGTTAALALRERGWRVSLIDTGPIPHPLAASTDISKVIRMEYGADEGYMALMETARDGWLQWNRRWRAAGRAALYNETGVVMLCREPMSPGGFEYESWQLLVKRGHSPERLDATAVASRFPAWRADAYVDGFFHARGGYAESGRVIAALAEHCRHESIDVIESHVSKIVEKGSAVSGVETADGTRHDADVVVVAAGAWTGTLVPALAPCIAATGHPVFHLRPRDAAMFAADRFPTFTADVSRTGYYGFPVNRDGVVKIANHGVGATVDPDGERTVTATDEAQLREFLSDTFPALADADIVYTRLCLYSDTQDEHFWIAADPRRAGLVVAGGGSGHGFKFAPVLGDLVADAVEGIDNPHLKRFAWRPELKLDRGREAARFHGEDERP